VYIVGNTNSSNFPVTSSYDITYNAKIDIFISKLNNNLSLIPPIPTLSIWGILVLILLIFLSFYSLSFYLR